jgi:hypothetical protein
MRVRVHSYRQQGNDWLPFLEDGRQIHLAAQPGGQEAFLALTEREGLYSSCRGTGKSLICGMTFAAHVGEGYGANWKGLLLRPTITGHVEMKSLLEQAFMAIWGNTVHYNINTSTFSWDSGEILKLGHFGELSDYSTIRTLQEGARGAARASVVGQDLIGSSEPLPFGVCIVAQVPFGTYFQALPW